MRHPQTLLSSTGTVSLSLSLRHTQSGWGTALNCLKGSMLRDVCAVRWSAVAPETDGCSAQWFSNGRMGTFENESLFSCAKQGVSSMVVNSRMLRHVNFIDGVADLCRRGLNVYELLSYSWLLADLGTHICLWIHTYSQLRLYVKCLLEEAVIVPVCGCICFLLSVCWDWVPSSLPFCLFFSSTGKWVTRKEKSDRGKKKSEMRSNLMLIWFLLGSCFNPLWAGFFFLCE